MSYSYVVLGAGRQGVALAYDLARNSLAANVRLVDSDAGVAQAAVERLMRLLPDCHARFEACVCDVSNAGAAQHAMSGANVVLSAVPYRFNAALTDAAIAARASFCDLGGNTAVVREQLARHDQAQRAGVSIVPDCGLAPGLGNTLAAHGIASMERPEHVHVRCGGLPQRPVGPLGYKLVFNFDGLINEYSGCGEFIRDGRKVEIPALSEPEEIVFDAPLGRCEAAVTSGGTSTCPDTYSGRLKTYDYKTVRYPGHFAVMRALFGLGCFDSAARVTLPGGQVVEPRQVLRRMFEERLVFPEVRDLVVLRVIVHGSHHDRPTKTQYDLFDRHDEATGFTAMERTTAFPAALVAYFMARRLVAPGAQPLETAVPADAYVRELLQHDIQVRIERTERAG